MKNQRKVVIQPSEVLAISLIVDLFDELLKIERKKVGELTHNDIKHWKRLKRLQKGMMQ